MAVRIIPKEQQAHGAFNGGEIVENKPIGFPQDHSSVRPYSSLFYWAHARAVTDSTIGLHPHQGFEICSFVLKGEIRHFDTKLNDWRPLSAGDVQIIRAGNGISHSEWMGRDGEMFQIWFDPNLRKTLSQPASYDDYRAADLPVRNHENTRVITIAGEGSPMSMDTPGVQIYRISLDGEYTLLLPSGSMASLYLISGAASVGGQSLNVSDFGVVYMEDSAVFSGQGDIFVIVSPVQPGYATYGH